MDREAHFLLYSIVYKTRDLRYYTHSLTEYSVLARGGPVMNIAARTISVLFFILPSILPQSLRAETVMQESLRSVTSARIEGCVFGREFYRIYSPAFGPGFGVELDHFVPSTCIGAILTSSELQNYKVILVCKSMGCADFNRDRRLYPEVVKIIAIQPWQEVSDAKNVSCRSSDPLWDSPLRIVAWIGPQHFGPIQGCRKHHKW